MKKYFRIAAPLIVPLSLYFLAFFCLNKIVIIPTGLMWLIKRLPYLLFGVAAVLSWRFNKSRVFFIVLVMAIIHIFITTPALIMNRAIIVPIAAILFPVNILVFTLIKERGIFTVWGLINSVFILIQTGLVYDILKSDYRLVHKLIEKKFLPLNFKMLGSVPQAAILISLIVLAILIYRYISGKSYLDAATMVALIAVYSALCMEAKETAIPVFFAASSLILIISVIQESYSMAFMDELTGLPSRRSLRFELMKLSGRYTIAMLDIDHFKKFNDTYGHDVGDQVLRMVAGCIRDVTGGGKPFRYGGEEFTVLFPNKGLKDSIPHLETLREAISQKGFYQRTAGRPKNKPKQGTAKGAAGKQLFVTISIGVAEKSEKNRLTDEVIKAADNALYRAKKKGRNCVSK